MTSLVENKNLIPMAHPLYALCTNALSLALKSQSPPALKPLPRFVLVDLFQICKADFFLLLNFHPFFPSLPQLKNGLRHSNPVPPPPDLPTCRREQSCLFRYVRPGLAWEVWRLLKSPSSCRHGFTSLEVHHGRVCIKSCWLRAPIHMQQEDSKYYTILP
jgi:hypothetical protein